MLVDHDAPDEGDAELGRDAPESPGRDAARRQVPHGDFHETIRRRRVVLQHRRSHRRRQQIPRRSRNRRGSGQHFLS